MTPYQIYTLVISCGVALALAVFLSMLIWYIYTLTMRLIYVGYWDQELVQEYEFTKPPRPRSRSHGTAGKVIAAVVCGVLTVGVVFAMSLGIAEGFTTTAIPSLRVVKSDSMSEKHEDNTYLVEHNLNNQMQTFDIIVTYAPPAEEDIQLYDVIVFEKRGELVVHRVVYIAEPTEEGDSRQFYTRGDAVKNNDTTPVEYSQIKGVYREERIPFIGSFVLFMQSPAGIICLMLAIAAMIVMPIVDDKIEEARGHRFRRLQTGYASIQRFYRKY